MAESVEAAKLGYEFSRILESYRGRIIKNILEHVRSNIPILDEASKHLINAGGKLLRPSLVVLACKAVGGDEDLATFASVGGETAHVASLIHDDIIDGDELRRNVKTVHLEYGLPLAILAGDFLIIKSFQMIERLVREKGFPAERAIELLRLSCEGALDVTEGEVMDILFLERDHVSLHEYLKMIELKTARAFEVSMKGGAILGFGSREEIEMLGNYGLYLGMAFQIEDDLLGSIGKREDVGKPISDIVKKRKNFLVCYVDTFGSPEQRRELRRILSKKEIDERELYEARNLFSESNAIEAAKNYIRDYTRKAVKSISSLKPSETKDLLIELAYYLANRTK